MGKLIESTFVSLDGVISNPQEWGPPYWDDDHTAYNRKLLFGSDAMLLGRVTYRGSRRPGPSAAATISRTASTRCRNMSPRTR
jgi:hypothetical protein